MGKEAREAVHVLIFPYPAQGHINPMLQFGKRLAAASRVKATLATTVYLSKSTRLETGSILVDTISDGYDETGFTGADSAEAYLSSLRAVGSKTLADLIQRHSSSPHPIKCVVYDSVIPWVMDVAKDHGLAGAAFFTQSCAVNNMAYYVYHGLLHLPISSTLVSIPGMPFLEVGDLPLFLSDPEAHPAYLEATLDQYSNVDKADFLLVNTVYELEEKEARKAVHVLIFPYPAQGHINPMLQFGKRLAAASRVKATLATTVYLSKSTRLETGSILVDTISDGYDETGFTGADSAEAYLSSLRAVGSKTLADLIQRHSSSPHPIKCVVYDSVIPWVMDVAKDHGLAGTAFFTQSCAVGDLPLFLSDPEAHPAYLEATLDQYSNVDKADFLLVNTVYELEEKAVDAVSTQCGVLTVGPTLPSLYLDNLVMEDKAYGLHLFNPDHETTTNWLKDKPPNSVVYVSFGSQASLSEEQMNELAWGLNASDCYYLWVIRASEQAKLPKHITAETGDNGVIVKWCAQLEVLSSATVGCFLTHCGWNSTLEALSLGVPMVAMPQWADQTTNAKLIQDVWKVGRRVKSEEKGIVTGREIAGCIREVMHGGKAEEMKANSKRLSCLIKGAVSKGGSSSKNIDKFVSKLVG
ncbi:hypothetical protein Nepgr_021580 [Nepenthes gracilis]|uniref:Glycosyltransferase n=1 Tax=Nepenthes gracilis TaxID=150966 RepID=A0AAD3XX61_NEPGR|nr:hypothetical protein Nepgr_021580 [Nepenthes gracilis]